MLGKEDKKIFKTALIYEKVLKSRVVCQEAQPVKAQEPMQVFALQQVRV